MHGGAAGVPEFRADPLPLIDLGLRTLCYLYLDSTQYHRTETTILFLVVLDGFHSVRSIKSSLIRLDLSSIFTATSVARVSRCIGT